MTVKVSEDQLLIHVVILPNSREWFRVLGQRIGKATNDRWWVGPSSLFFTHRPGFNLSGAGFALPIRDTCSPSNKDPSALAKVSFPSHLFNSLPTLRPASLVESKRRNCSTIPGTRSIVSSQTTTRQSVICHQDRRQL